MTNTWAVTTRELRSYFLSPLAYLVGAFFVFGSGLLFWLILQSNHEASVRGLISNVHVLFLFVIPMISMRLLIIGMTNKNNTCTRSEEHTSELQSQSNLVCRLLLEKKKIATGRWSHAARAA